jgi:PAS domain S-box-containing protein
MSEFINSKEYRQQELKKIIKDLHAGVPLEEVKERFTLLIKDIGPGEIAAMEQALVKEGLPESEIQKLCDVHVQVFKEALDVQEKPDQIPGHPVHTFIKENDAIVELIGRYRANLRKADDGDREALGVWKELHKELMEIEKHYSRKENILFPYLEKYGITAPPSVMWAIHDDIRAQWKQVARFLEQVDNATLGGLRQVIKDPVEPMLTAIGEMVYKENNIMWPMCLDTLNDTDWEQINRQSDEIGYTLFSPDKREWVARALHVPEAKAQAEPTAQDADTMKLDAGYLSVAQVNAMLKHIPMDMTFVDHEGKVRYFSQGKERIFTRTEAIIGRAVANCHPPDSVHVVMQIVEELKSGKRDVAEFWINFKGKFVHIRYFAVRDEQGKYLGVLEATQDVTDIRGLKGEKRLLDEEN